MKGLIRYLLLIAMLSFSVVVVYAQKGKSYEPKSTYYTQARQCLNVGDYSTAYNFLEKELAVNPKNGYAWFLKGWLEMYISEDISESLADFDRAVGLIPRKDKTFRSTAYSGRGVANRYTGNFDAAYNDFTQAIKIMPDPQYYINRGELLYSVKRYSEAMADFNAALKQNPDNPDAQHGVGKCYYAVQDYQKCLEWLSDCIEKHPEYADFYSLRALCYRDMRDYDNVAWNVVKALSIDDNKVAINMLYELADSAYSPTIVQLEAMHNADPRNAGWLYYMAAVSELAGRYDKALLAYKELYGRNDNTKSAAAERIAACWEKLGDYDNAVKFMTEAIALEDDEAEKAEMYFQLADLQDNNGEYDASIASFNRYVEANPQSEWGYSARAWVEMNQGKLEEAVADYNRSIAISPDYQYDFLHRGMLYRRIGEEAKAAADFEKVIALGAPSSDYLGALAYAYLYLGQKDNAKQMVESLLETDGHEKYYNAACIYSLMGETEKALDNLELSLSGGYRKFRHIARDTDLDNLRDLPRFKRLVEEYEGRMNAEIATARQAFNDGE